MTEAAHPVSPLKGSVLRDLRARAHALKPVVRISANGATESVLREIDRSLGAHELIKVHAALDGRHDREALLAEICAALGAQPVQVIGKMLVIFRPKPEADKPAPAAAKPAPGKKRPAWPSKAPAAGPRGPRRSAPPRKSAPRRAGR